MENTAQCHLEIRLQSTVGFNRKLIFIPTQKLSPRGFTHFCWNLYETTDDISVSRRVQHSSLFPLEQCYLLWITPAGLKELVALGRGGLLCSFYLLPPLDMACSCSWTSSMRPGDPCAQPVLSVEQSFSDLKKHSNT